MKERNKLKIAVFLSIIALVFLISFVGIYKYDKGSMKNILPEYQMGKDVKGSRFITYEVDTSTKEVEDNTQEIQNDEEQNTEETTR